MNKALAAITAVFLIVSTLLAEESAPVSKDLNLVVIVVCTFRADHLPFYGYGKNTAPFLNSLSEKSVVFDHAFSASGWTAPSTASIHSGVYPFQHGVVSGMSHTLKLREKNPKIHLNKLPAELDLLAEVAKAQGFRTFAVTDNLNIVAAEGFDAGFDRFQNFNYLSASEVSKQVVGWEQDIKKEGRYFLYLNFMDPHYPYHKRAPWYPGAKEAGEVEYVKQEDVPRDGIAAYDSEISYLDRYVGELAARFDWLQNSMIVVIGDHGEEFNEHGRWGHGQTLYQEIVHVPLVVYYPGITPHRVQDNVSSVDVLPTLRELLGAGVDSRLSGLSLVPYLRQSAALPKRPLFAHLQRMGADEEIKLKIQSIVKDNLKLIDSTRKKIPELYDLQADPGEKVNLYEKSPAIGAGMLGELNRYLSESPKFTGDKVQIDLTDESLQQLQSLGYVN